MDTQRSSAEMLVKKYGCKIVEEYKDESVSATKTKYYERRELTRLLDDSELSKFDVIVVYKEDRLARNPTDHAHLRHDFKEYGTPVVISSTETLYDTGELVPTLVRDGITKFEADNTRDRTRDTFVYKTQKGEWTGGKVPFGYVLNKKTGNFEKKDSELLLIKRIFHLYKQGHGFQTIATTLNQEAESDVSWRKERIKSIITNPFYAGYMKMNIRKKNAYNSINDREDWILGKSDVILEPVVTMEEWEYCFEMYNKKRKRQMAPKHFRTNFLLKDLLHCRTCNLSLQAKNQKTTSSTGKEYGESVYICKTCDVRIVDRDIHKYVFRILLNGVLTKDFHRAPMNLYDELLDSFESDERVLQEEISSLEGEIGKLAIEKNRIDDEIRSHMKRGDKEKEFIQFLLTYKIKLEKEEENIKQRIQQKKEKVEYIKFVLSDFSIWKELYHSVVEGENVKIIDTSFRRMALHLIEKIEVEKSKGSIKSTIAKQNKHSGYLKHGDYDIYITAKMNMEQEHNMDIELNF